MTELDARAEEVLERLRGSVQTAIEPHIRPASELQSSYEPPAGWEVSGSDGSVVTLTRPATATEEAWLRSPLREELVLGYAKYLGVPMSLIDGRPWVPTEAESG